MNRQLKRACGILSALVALGLVAGCATTPTQVAAPRLAAVHAAAGKSVGSFLAPQIADLYSWQALNNHELLLYTRPNKAWLLHLTPCPRLFRAPYIAVTSSMSQVDGFSTVYVFHGLVPCSVKAIQAVDVSQLKQRPVPRPGATLIPTSGGQLPGWVDASGYRGL